LVHGRSQSEYVITIKSPFQQKPILVGKSSWGQCCKTFLFVTYELAK
jgi:hypothetical protein